MKKLHAVKVKLRKLKENCSIVKRLSYTLILEREKKIVLVPKNIENRMRALDELIQMRSEMYIVRGASRYAERKFSINSALM